MNVKRSATARNPLTYHFVSLLLARSPVFSHLSTTLYGLSTIRAFKTQEDFVNHFDDHLDLHTSSWYLFITSTRWFGVRLDWISVIFIGCVTFSFMLRTSSGAEVGLAVASAITLSGMFQWGVRQSAEVVTIVIWQQQNRE